MINQTTKLILLLFIIVSTSSSCRKTVAARCDNYAENIADELNEVSARLSVYISDPTIANCNAYKDALLDYLNEAEDLFTCVPTASRSSWQTQIDESKQSVDDIDCM